MPEQNEEIVILEEDKSFSIEDSKEDNQSEKEAKKSFLDKKKIIIISSVVVALILIIITVVFLTKKEDKAPQASDLDESKIAQNIIEKERSPFLQSHVEDLLEKANLLYEQGEKKEALRIFEQVATYNEAISNYNIGVALMKEKNFKDAIESFKKAISNKEHRCVSAINSAVCALELKDEILFNYYIDLAEVYLPLEANAPLFGYYKSLIEFYKNNYFEALTTLRNTSEEFYLNQNLALRSMIYTLIKNYPDAIDGMEKRKEFHDDLTLGLLYANTGDFQIASNHFHKALQNNATDIEKTKMALGLTQLKLGLYSQSSSNFKDVFGTIKDEAANFYPIKVKLKESLFDVNYAQEEFENSLFDDKDRLYSFIFYFAPFKVFDAKQTIDHIRKGGVNIFIDEINEALFYLKNSSSLSKVNISIAKGIEKALEQKTYKAKEIFLSLVEEHPKHSILHYNLGLTYALLGDYNNGYKHLSRSYHLDPKNYLAGILALFNAQLIHKEHKKMEEVIKIDLENETNLQEKEIYTALLNLFENNIPSAYSWMEENQDEKPLSLLLSTIISQKSLNTQLYQKYSSKLRNILPNDIIANIIELNAKKDNKNIKEFSKFIQNNFLSTKVDLNPLFYGPKIVKESYVKALYVAGLIHHAREKVKEKVAKESDEVDQLLQTLAYIDLFSGHFEESYVLYNQLIDELGHKDSSTLFLAATAAIGAGHKENAIALLELLRFSDGANFEGRYALGILYLEVKNIESAIINFQKITQNGFQSKFFSFNIDK